MDIKITDKSLRFFLDTQLSPQELAQKISLCGPTFDKINKLENDYIFDIEVITNRIDTASCQGIARDSAAILKQMGIKSSFKNDPYNEKSNYYKNLPKTFSFEFNQDILSPRFVAVSLENVNIQESPEETKKLLSLCGLRPINNAVDITNELTILYGMPSHIFDLDKLASQKLIVRESKEGEIVITLDNKKNKLQGGDIIIEDAVGRIVDLCGVMGGTIAEVDQYTKNILLIVPTYNSTKIRRTSLYLQNRSLAAQIYEKQPDPELCLPVITKAIKLFNERSSSCVSSRIFDYYPNPPKIKKISINLEWINSIIGIEIPKQTVFSILISLGFLIEDKEKQEISCVVPSWRYFDINIREDLVEEIARVYGYYKLPSCLPNVNLAPEQLNGLFKTESKIKHFLSNQGFNEIYNNSLISEELILKTNLNPSKHLKLKNALSKDLEYLRLSLVPTILQNIKNNQGKSEEPFFLYELSNIYLPNSEKLPQEISSLTIASTTDFAHTKGILEVLLLHLNIKSLIFQPTQTAPEYYQNDCITEIISDKKNIGYIGQIKPTVLHNIGITSNPTIIELQISSLVDSMMNNYVYKPISEYPGIMEQLTISSNLPLNIIMEKIQLTSKLISKITYINTYNNNHSFKIMFASSTKNLTQTEVNEIKNRIINNFS